MRELIRRLSAWWADQQRVCDEPATTQRLRPADNPNYWKNRAHGINAYARRKGATGTIDSDGLRQLWEESCGRCYWCNCRIAVGNKQRRGGLPVATVDHVIPLSERGENAIANLQWACRPCNSTRGQKHLSGRPVAA